MSEHLDGELGPGGRGRIEQHLHDCHKCRELLSSLRATVAGLARIGTGSRGPQEESVAPSVVAHVHEVLAREGGDGRPG